MVGIASWRWHDLATAKLLWRPPIFQKGYLISAPDTATQALSLSRPVETRVALYLRVSTGRQAGSDLSIPDQRRQIECYCAARNWAVVERLLHARSPKIMPPRAVSGPILLTGICFCTRCSGGMTLRTGRNGSPYGKTYRYYACSTRARQGPTGCKGMALRMDRLDEAVIGFLTSDLLDVERMADLMAPLLVRRDVWADRRRRHVAELRERAADAEAKLRRLYEAVESGMLTSADRMFGQRTAELGAIRDQAEADADRIAAMVGRAEPALDVRDLRRMTSDARSKLLRAEDGARRALVRAFLQRVEVVSKHEARVVGSRSVLFRALAVAAGAKLAKAGFGEFGDTDNSYSFSFTL